MQTKQMTAEITMYKDFVKKYIDLDDELETEPDSKEFQDEIKQLS